MTILRRVPHLESFPDRPEVGDVFEPTTYWTDSPYSSRTTSARSARPP